MSEAQWLSISACAKALGIARPRLSLIVKDHKIETRKVGKEVQIKLADIQVKLAELAGQGKIRTGKKTVDERTETEKLMDYYRKEVAELREQLNQEKQKTEALTSLQVEVRLLKGAVDHSNSELKQKDETIAALMNQVELLHSTIQSKDKAAMEEQMQKINKLKGTIVGRFLGL